MLGTKVSAVHKNLSALATTLTWNIELGIYIAHDNVDSMQHCSLQCDFSIQFVKWTSFCFSQLTGPPQNPSHSIRKGLAKFNKTVHFL